MPKKDSRVDDYIAGAAGFAKPILKHLRKLVHTACPEVEETIKWRFPTFMYKGMLCGMAAFKEHCTFGAWKDSLIAKKLADDQKAKEAMGQLGRIASLSDLHCDKAVLHYNKKASALHG